MSWGNLSTYLESSSLFGLVLTLAAYVLAQKAYAAANYRPYVNPVLIAIVLVITVLSVTHVSYSSYFQSAQLVHLMLGPATVALAVPLYKQWKNLRSNAGALLGGLIVGSLVGIVSALCIAVAMGASKATLISLAPKSATTPIAMAVAAKLGGISSLTAVIVISAGICGAILAKSLLNLIKEPDHAIRGFALGVASHGIGTARAMQVSPEMGAFAGLGMSLNGILTAIVVPFLLPLFLVWLSH